MSVEIGNKSSIIVFPIFWSRAWCATVRALVRPRCLFAARRYGHASYGYACAIAGYLTDVACRERAVSSPAMHNATHAAAEA